MSSIDCPSKFGYVGLLAQTGLLLGVLLGVAAAAAWVSSRTTTRGYLVPQHDGLARVDVVFAARDALLFGIFGLGCSETGAFGQPFLLLPTWLAASGSAWLLAFLGLLAIRSRVPAPIDDTCLPQELAVGVFGLLAPVLAGFGCRLAFCEFHAGRCDVGDFPPFALAVAGGLAGTIGSLCGRALARVSVDQHP